MSPNTLNWNLRMSNLWLNWRFGTRHLQIGRDKPRITFRVNPYWLANKPATWFERYA